MMLNFVRSFFGNISLPGLAFESSETGKKVTAPALPRSVVAASILVNILGLALPLTILQVYDRILPNKATDTLVVLVLGLCGVLAIDALLKIIRGYLVAWQAMKYSHGAYLEAIRRILYARSDFSAQASVSQQMDSLRSLQALGDHYGGQARLLVIDIPASLIFLVVLFLIGGPVGLVPIALLALFAVITTRTNSKLNTLIENRSVQDRRKYDFILEVLSGLPTIKGIGLEPLIMRRYERLQKQVSQQGYDYIELSNHGRNLSGLFTVLTTVFVVSAGAFLAMAGMISVGTVAACTLLAGQVVQPMLRGINHWTDMQRIQHDYREASRLFDLPREARTRGQHIPVTGNISLENVSFRYATGSTFDIKDISLSIPAGQIIAFEGNDGSGRSTLTRLISGDLKPTAGRILIDGHDLFGENQRSLRSQIAYVGNDSEMFTGTILQNLTLFGSQADPRKARMAANLIGLEKDIHLLPKGYDTVLGAGLEENLTDSMLQRIAIARALAKEPKILLLDDANGALDHGGETALMEALQRLKGQLTLVIVTHRPSFRAIADIEYIIENGQLASSSRPTPGKPARTVARARPSSDNTRRAS
ncbi:hypothetical protein GCM10011316_01790 [Roseibium aquae]|uniref:ATP-binding cassette subfamily C protein LapB n=1 Tax=Roseibium aquae TaxID=1323746 RepID=A0A916WV80_9HYPH|nr:ATP-binding cassette domain-containing protein [Roseibium aquae]GGB33367.1 hypothetical protein GCM10011316_01790 [Roseibium aquae]